MRITGFPPIVSENATVLILGTMPGPESLRCGQYYAAAGNAFWDIMGSICGAGRSLDYRKRIRRLQEAGIAVWDVLQQCERQGSRDAGIDPDTEMPNKLADFLKIHAKILHVFFNGQKPEAAFYRHVWPGLSADIKNRVGLATLPSTSGANTWSSKEEKLQEWRRRIAPCLKSSGG